MNCHSHLKAYSKFFLFCFIVLFIPQVSFAEITFADVALYVGQRRWSDSVKKYRSQKIKELQKNPLFFDKYTTDEFYVTVPIGNENCKIGGLRFYKGQEENLNLPEVIFFYGNAMDAFSTAQRMARIQSSAVNQGHTVILMDYPGYGLSECQPKESSLITAANAVLDLHTRVAKIKPIVIGYSLGGAIATQVAANRTDIQSLILVSTFSHMHSVVDHLHQAYGTFKFKVASKLKGGPFKGEILDALLSVKGNNEYASLEHIKKILVPVFLAHGTVDETIPVEHFGILENSLKSSHKCFMSMLLEAVNHSGLFEAKKSSSGEAFWKEIMKFTSLEFLQCHQTQK